MSQRKVPDGVPTSTPTHGRDETPMTTSRSVAKSSSMFSLSRRPSVSLAASSPPLSPTAPPPSHMTASTNAQATTAPSAANANASPVREDHDDGATSVTRRKSNNDKLHRLGTSSSSITTTCCMASPPSLSQRKLLRSPTAGNLHVHQHQQHQQQRQKSRDFALAVSPTASPIPHENCSSLRDQFLKIKERFSAPSPVGAAGVGGATSPSSSSGANAVRVASPAQSLLAGEGDGKSTVSDRRGCSSLVLAVSVSTERLLEELNERTKRGYAGDLLWPNHAHVERWYVQDNNFKGSMTCGSMEKGAEVIARIARVISSRMSPPAPPVSVPAAVASPVAGTSTPSKGTSRFNPDVSLQWIGRQLWAVTVSLPLTRSGELTGEHASVAQAIDDAIAEEVEKAPQECGPRATVLEPLPAEAPESTSVEAPCKLNPLLDRLEEEFAGADEESSQHSATLPLEITAALAGEIAATHLSIDVPVVGVAPVEIEDELVVPTPEDPATDHEPQNPEVDRRAIACDSSVSTVLAEEDHPDHHHADDEDQASSRSYHTTQEDGDTLSALPLSLSMLSFTSLQSLSGAGIGSGSGGDLHYGLSLSNCGGGGGGGGVGGGSDPLQLHNGCGRDDDPLHRVPPDKTGWLKKKNGLNAWQPRYFELKGNRLFYFATESEGIPRGAIVLDHAHVLRGKGDQSMTFTICASSGAQNLQMIKFSSRMTSQVHPRKSCVLRVVHDSEDAIAAWVTAINRASFYCHLSTNSSASGSTSSVPQSSSSTTSTSSPSRKKKTPFFRLRSASSSASSAEDDATRTSTTGSATSVSASPTTIDSASYHHYGSVKYLEDTDPLLWEIHPHDQQKIRKKASLARTRSDYLSILSKYTATFRQIFLPRPRPITIEQTLRDILPELFLINNVLYGGGDENNGLEHIFEVLDALVKKFAGAAQHERVRAVSALLQACARTISGGDSYFVVHSLLGNPCMIIRPAEARGHPIEIDVSVAHPSQFCITVFSAFSFHHIEDVENFGDHGDGGAMPEPLLRVQTFHVQEFDFANGKSTRWLRIRTDGMKDDYDIMGGSGSGGRLGSSTTIGGGGSGGGGVGGWMSKRSPSETGFGALLDALS